MKNVKPLEVVNSVPDGEVDPTCNGVELIARECHAELLRVLRSRLRSEHDAQDLSQEAYARLLRYQGQITERDELRRVLFKIASNLIIDHWRWRGLRNSHLHISIDKLDLDSEEPSLVRQVAGEEQLARLEQVVLGMPAKRRVIFLLSRVNGMTNSEVAQRCGISIKMVEKHLAIALGECRALAGDL